MRPRQKMNHRRRNREQHQDQREPAGSLPRAMSKPKHPGKYRRNHHGGKPHHPIQSQRSFQLTHDQVVQPLPGKPRLARSWSKKTNPRAGSHAWPEFAGPCECATRFPHPPATASDKGVNTSAPSRPTKIRSATEGIARRVHTGVPASEELLEPSAIALNLIEVGPRTAND